MVMLPKVHKKVKQTGNFRLKYVKKGLFKNKRILILETEFLIGIYQPPSDEPCNTYTVWEESKLGDDLPFKVVE